MTQRHDHPDFEERRAHARRTAWIIAVVVLVMFAVSIIDVVVRR